MKIQLIMNRVVIDLYQIITGLMKLFITKVDRILNCPDCQLPNVFFRAGNKQKILVISWWFAKGHPVGTGHEIGTSVCRAI